MCEKVIGTYEEEWVDVKDMERIKKVDSHFSRKETELTGGVIDVPDNRHKDCE